MSETDPHTAAVREFNRYYTRRVGALGGHLGSEFSLTEVRVLYELAHRDAPTASAIAAALDLDRGYLSRLLRSFKKRGLISTSVSKDDRRRTHLRLTPAGKRAFAPLNKRADADVAEMLDRLSPAQQQRVVGAMTDIRSLLAPDEKAAVPAYTIRSHRPGDMGWITYRHAPALRWSTEAPV